MTTSEHVRELSFILLGAGATGISLYIYWNLRSPTSDNFNRNSKRSTGLTRAQSYAVFNELKHLREDVGALRTEVASLKRGLSSRRESPIVVNTLITSQETDNDSYESAEESPPDAELEVKPASSRPVSAAGKLSRRPSQSGVATSLRRIDKLLAEESSSDLTYLRNELEKLLPSAGSCEGEVLWRLAKVTFKQSECAGKLNELKMKKSFAYEAKHFAFRSKEHAADSAEAWKWSAITLGNLQDYEGTKQRIEQGYEFRALMTKSLELDSFDHVSHYLLARWFYGCYDLTWTERKLATALFGEPPFATIEEALEAFLLADELSPEPWKENKLFIAKCFLEKKDYVNARRWLVMSLEVPANNPEDEELNKEAQGLLPKCD